MPRIFEPFFRGDNARHEPGNGLGLPVVRRVAELHGGTVAVEQGAGASTTVWLPLPLQP